MFLRSFIVSDYIQLYEIHFAKFVWQIFAYTLRTLSFFCRVFAFEYLLKINWIYLSTEMSLFLDCLCCSLIYLSILVLIPHCLYLLLQFILTLEIRKTNSSNFFFQVRFWFFLALLHPQFQKKKKVYQFLKKKKEKVPALLVSTKKKSPC